MIEGRLFRFDVFEISIERGESCIIGGFGSRIALRIPCGHVVTIIWVMSNAGCIMVADMLWE